MSSPMSGVLRSPRPRRIVIVAAPGLRGELAEQLARHPEFEIAEAQTPEEGERLVAAGAVDILLLDEALGPALALFARERFAGPIFLIGGAGARDGDAPAPAFARLARPLRVADLLARLRSETCLETTAQEVVIGRLRFRPGAFELVDATGPLVALTEKEAAILARLVEADGEIVTKEILLRDVWGYRPDVTTRTLETHLSRLRRKIEAPAGPRVLLTEKSGYRLVFRRPGFEEAP